MKIMVVQIFGEIQIYRSEFLISGFTLDVVVRVRWTWRCGMMIMVVVVRIEARICRRIWSLVSFQFYCLRDRL